MKVLIATVTAGGGHVAAAAALEQAWRARRPDDIVETWDLMRFFSPVHQRIYSKGFVKFVEHAPELWGLVFKRTDSPDRARRLTKVRQLFGSASRQRFARALSRFSPRVMICTHYLPLETFALHQQDDRFIASVITDFEAHALWMETCVDLYCVAHSSTGNRLMARGVAQEKIVPTGIPISSNFSCKVDPCAMRRSIGLRDDLPILLVLGGGFGMGPVEAILRAIDEAQGAFQLLVVTGRNQELRRDLACQDWKHPARILGYAGNMHELMAIASLIISKPGGLTTSEALAMGKPLVITNPIPGQEAANSDFLLEQGAAVKVNRVEDLTFRLPELLNQSKLTALARAAKSLGRPEAAKDVCVEILRRIKV